MSILKLLETKAALQAPITFDDLADLHAHIAQIELGYQALMEKREAEILKCHVRKAAA